MAREALCCVQLDDDARAFHAAVQLLRRVEPFLHYPFGDLSATLLSQLRRRHYALTVQGERVVGYAGWALCDRDMARDWVEDRRVPTTAETLAGSTVVIMTFCALIRPAVFVQLRHIRELYPGTEFYFRRAYQDARSRPGRLLNMTGRSTRGNRASGQTRG